MYELWGLKSVRERKGLTVREVSEATGLSISSVSQLENVRRKAHESTLLRLVKALEASPIDLQRAGWFDMDEKGRALVWAHTNEAQELFELLPDETLHWLALTILDEERRRGIPVASLDEEEAAPEESILDWKQMLEEIRVKQWEEWPRILSEEQKQRAG